MENIRVAVQATLNLRKHHAADAIVVREDITLAELAGHVVNMAHVALHTCEFNVPELRTLNPNKFDATIHLLLEDVKHTVIQGQFDAALKAYQRPLKEIEKLDKQYASIRDSKNPSKARLEVIAEQTDKLHVEARTLFPAVLNARRAEETFRAIPIAYAEQTVESWNAALKLMLLADGYNPEKFMLADSIRKFAK